MNTLQLASIAIEGIVTILGLKIFLKKKKSYGLFIALTFGIYVYYDLVRLMTFIVPLDTLYFLFFIASLSILIAVWQLYKKTK